MLEADLKLEKDARLLSETHLDVACNQWDLAQNELVHLNKLIENIFIKSEAIKNLVNNGYEDNTYNLGWLNWYNTGEKFPPRFYIEHPYVPLDRTFHCPINEKTYPKDIQCHFWKLRVLRNNCVIEELLLETSGFSDNRQSIPVNGTIYSR